jgi:putative SOS response-associated peptidase YedK
MCGRYGRRADKQRIAEWFHTHNTDVFNDEYYEINSARLAPSYNISPESIQPVVRLDRNTGERVLALMKWGLVPYWILLAKSAATLHFASRPAFAVTVSRKPVTNRNQGQWTTPMAARGTHGNTYCTRNESTTSAFSPRGPLMSWQIILASYLPPPFRREPVA